MNIIEYVYVYIILEHTLAILKKAFIRYSGDDRHGTLALADFR